MNVRTLALQLALVAAPLLSAGTLDINWVDVEGGAATLIVTPYSETILMDAGWPGFGDRDPIRIVNVLDKEVGRNELDYFIALHFHRDHTGGGAALASMIPIGTFIDHGDRVEFGWNERADAFWKSYVDAAGDRRMQVGPGQRLPLKNTDFLFVAARSRFLDRPLSKQGSNPVCREAKQKRVDKGENGKSVGFLVGAGEFEFLDLGDLSWNHEIETACPTHLFGEIGLYQVIHHGMHMSGAPAHIRGIRPLVAALNNGPRKGVRPAHVRGAHVDSVAARSLAGSSCCRMRRGPQPAKDSIANLGETEGCEGHWIEASVQPDGRFP